MNEYPWYEAVEGEDLCQGDLLVDFEVLLPRTLTADDTGQAPAEYKAFDLVIMTQTCDIVQGKVESLLLCPRWDLWSFVDEAKKRGENWGKGIREDLRRGNLPGYHLLNDASQDGIRVQLGIVDFHEVYTAPTNLVGEFARSAGKRLRLLPPYREHLAQASARFFMRVGLPVDIPSEKIRSRPA